MNVLLSHPTGNSNVRAVIAALSSNGLLAEFNTTLASPHSDWFKYMPKKLIAQSSRRIYPLQSNKLVTHPFLELARLSLPALGLRRLMTDEYCWAGIDSVYKNFDKAVAKRLNSQFKKKQITAVYGYEDGALNTFMQAKKLGVKCIYDLPIAYWETGRRLMFEEAERLPAWADTLGGGVKDSVEKLERKTRELELADVVIAPGDFVLHSLPEWAKNKQLLMTPFGSPSTSVILDNGLQENRNKRKLRVLFAGTMSQRKGLGDLFSAMKLLNRNVIELIVMGSLMAPLDFYKKQFPDFTYLPSRPHEEVLRLMRTCDVLCLPSIVEGRALVMQEAMSQGMPIIITANTGGEDLVKAGKTGFLVPIRSSEAIAEKLNWFIENRAEIPEMGIMAQQHAAKYTWERYGSKIVESILTS